MNHAIELGGADLGHGAVPAPAPAPARRLLALGALGVPSSAGRRTRLVVLGLVLIGAVMVAASAIIHLHLWLAGYRNIHKAQIGPLFLAQFIGGVLLAPPLVWFRRLALVVAGAGYLVSTIVGLWLSDTVGFFGFHDSLSVPWATPSLVIEIVGAAALVAAAAGVALSARRA